MIRLKNILEKKDYGMSPRSKDIEMEDAADLFQKNCAYFTNNPDTWIYRGVRSSNASAMFVSPSKHERISANTGNHYTLLLDNSPFWKDYPKRSKSLICADDARVASNYAGPHGTYVVIPYSGAKVGICSSVDFWNSFDQLAAKGIYDMDDFNSSLRWSYSHLRTEGLTETETLDDRNPSAFFEQLKDYDKPECRSALHKRNKDDRRRIHHSLFASWLDSGKTFTEYLFEIMNPEKNNFKLSMIEDFKTDGDTGKEVWTDSDSLMISKEDIYVFLESVDKIRSAKQNDKTYGYLAFK